MGRVARASLTCSAQDRIELERISRSHSQAQRRVERARIILACLAHDHQAAVAQECGTRPNTVNKWRGRFMKHGMAGLEDAPRCGAPARYGKAHRDRLLERLETPPPKGQAGWDGKALAQAVGGTASTAWRYLRKEGIQLQRMRSWCVSTDPQFAAKAADVIGLYLNPPERAIVFSVDEKPTIQALSRKTGYVQTSSGKLVRSLQSTYRRNGTLNLFAALNVATGEIKSSNHRHQEASRLPSLHGRCRPGDTRHPGDPRHPRQLQHPQEKRQLAQSPCQRHLPLHPH